MFPEVDIVETGHNLGYAEGNNVGVRAALQAGAESVLVLNNDTEVTPGFLEAFMNRSAPVQGGKPHRSDDRNLLDHLGGNWNPETANFDMIGRGEPAADWNESIELDYVCGVSIFALREVWEKVGLFDPRYFLFWEEADWCRRAVRHGYRPTVCPEAVLYHRGSASFIGGRPHTTYYWARNRLLWIEQHSSTRKRRKLMPKVRADTWKALRRSVTSSLQSPFVTSSSEHRSRRLSYLAEVAGVIDYYRRRFGCGPKWVSRAGNRSLESIFFGDGYFQSKLSVCHESPPKGLGAAELFCCLRHIQEGHRARPSCRP